MLSRLLLLAGLLVAPAGLAAQQPCRLHIHGQAHAADGSVLAGATVLLQGTTAGTLADAEGHFHLDGLCPGIYMLEVRYVGLQPQRLRIQVQQDRDLSFTLLPDSSARTEVIIRGLPYNRPESRQQLAGADLLATKGLNLAEALQQIPGVTVLQTGPTIAKPVLHGMSGNRVLILNNGIRHEAQQWGTEHAPEIDPLLATRLTVVRGAASIRYGADAIAGVVLVEPPALPDSAGTLNAEVNLVGATNSRTGTASGQIQGAPTWLPGLSWRLQGTLKRGGDFRTPDYFLANTAQRERNYSAALGYRGQTWQAETFYSYFDNQVGIIEWAHAGNLNDLRRVIERGGPLPEEIKPWSSEFRRPRQDIEHHLLKTRLQWDPNPGIRLQLIHAWQRNYRAEFDRHRYRVINGESRNIPSDEPAMTFELQTHTVDAIASHIGETWSWEGGIQALHQANEYGGAELIPFYRQRGLGGFAVLRRTREHWTHEAGVRYDVRMIDDLQSQSRRLAGTEYQYSGWSGNIGTSYTTEAGWQYRVQAASHWRAPNINELYSDGLHHGTVSYEVGDPGLQPERAYSLVATVETPASHKFGFRVSPYVKYVDNFIQLVVPGSDTVRLSTGEIRTRYRNTLRGTFLQFFAQSVDAWMYGLDLNAWWNLSDRWRLSAAGSLVRMQDANTNEWLPFAPPDQLRSNLRYTLPSSKWQRGTFVEIQARAVDRQWRYDYGDVTNPPAGYVLWDVNAGTSFSIGNQPVNLQVTVQNVLNTSYRDYLDRLRYYAIAPGIGALFRIQIPINRSTPSNS